MAGTKTFGHFDVAAQMRDVFVKIAQKEIDKQRPLTKVAVVKSINTSQLVAEVQMSGDEGTLKASFGYSLMPRAVGDLVRVAGKVGNYYITEILNNTGAHATYEPLATTFIDGTTGAIIVDGDLIEDLTISNVKIANGSVTQNKLNVVMGGGNMMSESSFENILDFMTGWTVSGTAPTRETTIVHGLGLAASKFTATTVAYKEVTGLQAGQTYSVTAYAYISGGATIAPTMRVADGTGSNSQDQNVVVQGTWVRAVALYVANATGKVRVTLLGSSTGAGTGTVVWDDVQVELGDVPTAWNPRVAELLPGTIKTAMLETGAINIGGSDKVVFAPGYDPSTKATITDLNTAVTNSLLLDNYLTNPTFDDWPIANAAPTGYVINSGTPVRETTTIRTSPTALRFNVSAGTANYIQPSVYPVQNSAFVTIRADVHLVSGGWGGSGVLVRWISSSGTYDSYVNFGTLLSSVGTGAWTRVETVVPRPSGYAGTFTRCEIWPIGGSTAIGTIAAKNIIFDQLAARPSTVDEINAWTAGLWAYPGTTKINGGLLQTGTVIADYVQASAVNALTEIVGPAIKTASTGERVVIRNDGTGGVIEFFTGISGETAGFIDPTVYGGYAGLKISSGKSVYSIVPKIEMYEGPVNGSYGGYIDINADVITIHRDAGSLVITSSGTYLSGPNLYLQGFQYWGQLTGEFNNLTDAAGTVTITHGFGAQNRVFLQKVGSSNWHYDITAITSNTFTVTARDSDGNALITSTVIRFFYKVVGY